MICPAGLEVPAVHVGDLLLGEGVDLDAQRLQLHAGHVIIDGERCTSCQMCATFCPTEAIHKFGDAATAAETGKPFGIDHYTGRCVQCHCCEDICPTGALTLSTDVFATDVTRRGRSERIEMRSRKYQVSSPKSIVNAMSDLLGVPNVYER